MSKWCDANYILISEFHSSVGKHTKKHGTDSFEEINFLREW